MLFDECWTWAECRPPDLIYVAWRIVGQMGNPGPSPPFSDEEKGVVLLPHDDIVLEFCPAASENVTVFLDFQLNPKRKM